MSKPGPNPSAPAAPALQRCPSASCGGCSGEPSPPTVPGTKVEEVNVQSKKMHQREVHWGLAAQVGAVRPRCNTGIPLCHMAGWEEGNYEILLDAILCAMKCSQRIDLSIPTESFLITFSGYRNNLNGRRKTKNNQTFSKLDSRSSPKPFKREVNFQRHAIANTTPLYIDEADETSFYWFFHYRHKSESCEGANRQRLFS